MKVNIPLGLFATIALVATSHAQAAVYTIGDNDGYGLGIPDGGSHAFSPVPPDYDQRSADEKAATNGAQFTDTFSTTHPGGFSPQAGAVATFTFANLGKGWSSGELSVDMAGFEAKTYGATLVHVNGIKQDWAFDDGPDKTVVRNFKLSQAIITAINSTGEMVIDVDRNNSNDFYGFDYLKLTSDGSNVVHTPIPPAIWLFGSALACLGQYARRRKAIE